jgi:hypothetical protein
MPRIGPGVQTEVDRSTVAILISLPITLTGQITPA